MQLELFPDLYKQPWICELCEGDTSNVEYDYLGSGTNHLGCELKVEMGYHVDIHGHIYEPKNVSEGQHDFQEDK